MGEGRVTEITAKDAPPRQAEGVQDELLPDGGMILFHEGRSELFTLNPTAALVWECCDGEHDLAALVAEVRDVFPDAPSVEADVRAVLADLRERGMLASETA